MQAVVERIVELERGRHKVFAVEVGPLKNYYPAEEYHQNYLDKNPGGYCHISPAKIKLLSSLKIDAGAYKKPAAETIRDKLTAEQFQVTQQNGTERPFHNEFCDKFAKGIYVDIFTPTVTTAISYLWRITTRLHRHRTAVLWYTPTSRTPPTTTSLPPATTSGR